MMNRKIPVRGYLFMLSFLCASLLVASQVLAVAKPRDVRTIYELSSLERQSLNLSRTFIEEGLAMGRQELPDDSNSRLALRQLEIALHEHYAPERLKAKLFNGLTNVLDSRQTQRVIEIMNKPAWQRATALERKANSFGSTKKLEEYVTGKLQQQTPRQIRVDLIRELLELNGMTTLMMELMISASVTTIDILLPQGAEQLHFEAEIRKRVESMRAEYNELLVQQLLYTYRHMPDEQLKDYVNYYKTPAIANLNRAFARALREAFK